MASNCSCGRNPGGGCTGLHKMSNEDYKKYLAQQTLKEQVKPELLKG